VAVEVGVGAGAEEAELAEAAELDAAGCELDAAGCGAAVAAPTLETAMYPPQVSVCDDYAARLNGRTRFEQAERICADCRKLG
jgi:hypothetical protein